MPSSEHSSHERLSSRASSRDRLDRERVARYQAPLLNNGQPDPRYVDRERDNRYNDNVYVADGTVGSGGAQASSNLPNGFKPSQASTHRERTNDARHNQSHTQSQSDSDDEDWC